MRRLVSFFFGVRAKDAGIEQSSRRKIDRLEAAANLQDLAALPGNRFEVLKGDRQGQYSIRINDQWHFSSNGLKDPRTRECRDG
ncbi:MAG: type II toxin-antitoxin system RelE/ParE family toxin [Bryobacterales bacterium]|nr:type II toxin-antitoxin system RelE/ParE family toxin [Bryobacterales bacterium]